MADFPHPCLILTPLLVGDPAEFLDETYTAKTRWMRLSYSENSWS